MGITSISKARKTTALYYTGTVTLAKNSFKSGLLGWLNTETENAKYSCCFDAHILKQDFSHLEVDAWIFEGHGPYTEDLPDFAKRKSERFNISGNAPIFLGELNSKREYRVMTPLGVILIPFAIGGAKFGVPAVAGIWAHNAIAGIIARKGEIRKRKFLIPLQSFSDRLLFGRRLVPFREALVAEKAEKTIAPLLQKQFGRKPVIGIVFGAGHGGIIKMLHNPVSRRRALSRQNLRLANGEHSEMIEKIFELTRDTETGSFSCKPVETGIIPPKFRPYSRRAAARLRLGKMKIKKRLRELRAK